MCSSQNNFVVITRPRQCEQCMNLGMYHNGNLDLYLIVLVKDLVQGTGFAL